MEEVDKETCPDGQVSPHEALYQVKPDVSRFRVFGCLCWYLLPEHERRSKVSPRSVPAINLGCDPQRKGHIIYIPATGKVTTAYHLTFQESSFIPLTPDGDAVLPPASNALGDHVPLYMERTRHRRPRIVALRKGMAAIGAATMKFPYAGRWQPIWRGEPISKDDAAVGHLVAR